MSFKVGDVVRLKSGGASMTVSGFDERGQCHCVWHDGTSGAFAEKSGLYAPAMLAACEPTIASNGKPPETDTGIKVYAEGDD